MTRMVVAFSIVAALVASGCSTPARSTVPFYDDALFTARWDDTAHRVADFALTSQEGRPITSGDLSGHVYVASFIYTRCSAVCPLLVSNLKKAQSALAGHDVRIVSFTVTPDTDSPEVLREFGIDNGIDANSWTLVTGDRAQIYSLARDSYFADARAPEEPRDGGQMERALLGARDILHTETLVLVDGLGRLRGVYNGTQPFEIEHLIDDARALSPEP